MTPVCLAISKGTVEEPLNAFAGNYRYTWYPQSTLGKLAVLIGFAPEFEVVCAGACVVATGVFVVATGEENVVCAKP